MEGETDLILTGDIGSECLELVYSSGDMGLFLLEFELRWMSMGRTSLVSIVGKASLFSSFLSSDEELLEECFLS